MPSESRNVVSRENKKGQLSPALFVKLLFRLECEVSSELDNSSRNLRRGDLAESRGVHITIGIRKLGMVQSIKHIDV